MLFQYETGKSYSSDYLKLLSSELWHRVFWYMAYNVLEDLAASVFNFSPDVVAARSSESMVIIYQTTWRHVPRIPKS